MVKRVSKTDRSESSQKSLEETNGLEKSHNLPNSDNELNDEEGRIEAGDTPSHISSSCKIRGTVYHMVEF